MHKNLIIIKSLSHPPPPLLTHLQAVVTKYMATPEMTGRPRPLLAKGTQSRPSHLHHLHILPIVPPVARRTHKPIELAPQRVVVDQRHRDAHQLDQALPEQLPGHVVEANVPLLAVHRGHVVQTKQKVNHRGHPTRLQEAKQVGEMQQVQSPFCPLEKSLDEFVVCVPMGEQIVAVARNDSEDVVQD